ncbi:MAG: TerB family tellurite resistance protein [Burkholderiales bacterium]
MLKTIQSFFEKYAPQESENDSERRVQIATAALLVEVTRMDNEFSEEECAVVLDSVRGKFGLSEEQARELIAQGSREAKDATDYHQFTREINRAFSPEQKIRLIERLWQIAYADKNLNKYEDHLVRKVADLLYVPHAHVIAAKNKARDA